MAAHQRIQACLAALRAENLDGLVGFTGSIHNFLQCEPVFTLTGFKTVGECVVILDANGDTTLIVTPSWDGARAADRVPGANVIPSDNLVASLAAYLRQHPLPAARTAIAGLATLSAETARASSELIGDEARIVDQIVRRIGARKFPDELDNARRATEIAEAGYKHLLEVLRPGMSEYELAAELFCHTKALGSEDNFLLMSSSTHNLAVRAPRRRVMMEGDLVLVELTPCYQGQFSQICRTVLIGEPWPMLQEKFGLLREANRVGLEAARTGTTVSTVAEAINDVFQAAGYGAYCKPPFMRVRGHGLGTLSDLPGDVGSGNETELETDMVFIIHPNQYIPETGYLMCGEPVRIGESGAEALTRRAAALDCVGV